MKLNLKYKKMIRGVFCISIAFLAIVLAFQFFNSTPIQFESERNIEINSLVDYSEFIKKVKDGNKEDVIIDSSKVNVNKIGEYSVIYKFHDSKEVVKVNIVDTTAPEFDVKSKKVALNQIVDPSHLVHNIKDATKTSVRFKKEYRFDKLGEKEVEVIVEDEANNRTIKKVKVEVVKDETAPEIIASNTSILVGTKTDLKSLVTLKDDFDSEPTVTIEEGEFNVDKIGSYHVKFIAKDASGNQSEKTITIQVIDKTSKNEKVVYLTFDDGPSKYTPEVLKILEKYNCKATFFITGMNASYRKYIKVAHDQGHTIGLHTYSHNYSKVYASVDAYFKDLEKIGQLAKEYIGFVPKYIRFPGGGSNTISARYTKGIMTKLTKMVEEKGYKYYDWNAENGDGYSKMSQSEMLKRATTSSANQIMILMHDANGKQNTVDILPKVIEHYQKRGYTFKAIDDSSIVPHQRVNN